MLALALFAQQRVEAGDQALAGEVRVADLGESRAGRAMPSLRSAETQSSPSTGRSSASMGDYKERLTNWRIIPIFLLDDRRSEWHTQHPAKVTAKA